MPAPTPTGWEIITAHSKQKQDQLQNTKVNTENSDQAKTTIKVIISLTISEKPEAEMRGE